MPKRRTAETTQPKPKRQRTNVVESALKNSSDVIGRSGAIPGMAIANWIRNLFRKGGNTRQERSGTSNRPTRQVRQYGNLAQQAYNGTDERSAQIGGRNETRYRYVRDWSDEQTAVYQNDDELVVALRGTANADDILTDAALGFGRLEESERAQRTRERIEELLRKAEGRRVVVVGHSLGGSLTNMVADEYGDRIAETHAFNPGGQAFTSSFEWGRPSTNSGSVERHEHYIEGDPIGAMQRVQSGDAEVHVYAQVDPSLGFHTIRNFI